MACTNKVGITRFLGLALLTLAAHAEDSRQFATDQTTGAISLRVDGKTCWTYVPQSKEGKPYFHPLNIPGTDITLTNFRPPDHPWHLGFWFSWKFINGVNFWEPDTNASTRVLSQAVTPAEDKTFRTEAVLSYIAKGTEVVHENRTVRVVTQTNGTYTIEWDSKFTAQDTEAVFDCTSSKRGKDGHWASGGYAGLMWRFTDGTALSYTFTNSAGQADVITCGEKSDRMEILATSKRSDVLAKVTFRDHPENPRFPTPWFARYSPADLGGRGYYLVGPSMIFHEPLTLAPGAVARFRYTVTVERL